MKHRLRFSLFFDVTRHMSVVDLISDVSGRSVGPIFKGQAVLDPWMWDRWVAPKVVNYYSTPRRATSTEERRRHSHSKIPSVCLS